MIDPTGQRDGGSKMVPQTGACNLRRSRPLEVQPFRERMQSGKWLMWYGGLANRNLLAYMFAGECIVGPWGRR